MQRTYVIETTELDEKALRHAHRSELIDFAFDSVLESIKNSAREQFIRDARVRAQETGEHLPNNEDDIIEAFEFPDADTRHAEAIAKAEAEVAEQQRLEAERQAQIKAEEDERIRQAVLAALAERDAQQAQGDLFTETQS